ncbi:MAG TPA: 23S rRNA (pseudouridine(1915)-N(3))-methyltransferase RlmH [Polyangiaceae bacterium]|nr:23S rRNA (pseudouridine(1915)-N(3))-methyltransferase RlmH [Polyangiaceae bacterium]
MKLAIVAVGRLKEAALRTVLDDYLGRLSRYVPVVEKEVKTGGDLADAVPPGAFVVAMEVEGDSVTSTELARRVERWGSRGKGVVAFLIGGADGIPKDLSARADARLSLSKLTLPHRLARVLLAEQLYRAMTILRGEPYARE